MVAEVKKNSGANAYPDPEGIVNDTIRGRKWDISFGETDADTRDNRLKRKASVTTLSPKLAIVNVYQLVRKDSRRLFDKRGEKNKGKQGKMGRPVTSGSGKRKEPKEINPGVYGFKLPAFEEKDGEILNEWGNPVTRDGEVRSEYNPRIAQWRRLKGLDAKPTQQKPTQQSASQGQKPQGNKSEKPTQEQEATRSEEQKKFLEKHQAAQDAAEQRVREMHAKEPRYILGKRADILKILTTPTESRYSNDPAYSKREPDEDFDRLTRVMTSLQNAKLLPRKKDDIKNPPIVGIKTVASEPPRYYYVRNDISESRKRKMVKVQAKRPIKKQVPSGSKRRVVMRVKKGGKR